MAAQAEVGPERGEEVGGERGCHVVLGKKKDPFAGLEVERGRAVVRPYAHAPAPLARQDHQLVRREGVTTTTISAPALNPQAVTIPPLLRDLLAAAGPSGHEEPAAAVWRAAGSEFAEVHADTLGTSYARVGTGNRPLLAVIGHIDEIGFAITHIGDDGLLAYRRPSAGSARMSSPASG